MLLTPIKTLPEGEEWIFEPKLDGYRALAYVTNERAVLRSRQGNSLNNQFSDIAQQLPDALAGHAAVVDGEVIGLDPGGGHNLRTVRQRNSKLVYYIFDILELDEEPLTQKPWHERHTLLESALMPREHIGLCPYFPAEDREALLIAARGLALEGIVAKRINSKYWPKRRSKDWLKLKFT